MTGSILRLAAVVFILVVGVLSITRTDKSSNAISANNTSPASKGESPSTWEYRMVNGVSLQEVMENANKLGSESWELVNVTRNEQQWVAFLKRAKEKEATSK
jgi:hypothetical protein